VPTLVGIDHGFSFPLRYFETHGLLPDWPRFLDDFQRHWPTDEDHVFVEFVRDGIAGNGAARMGNARWRRLTEERAGGAKSVFHFDVPGSVAKSTHAGIPWLRFIRTRLGSRVHFWPFDGWEIPAFWGSPVAINGNIYITTMLGITYVIDSTAKILDESAILSINDLGPSGETWSLNSISYASGHIYHRSLKELVSIASK